MKLMFVGAAGVGKCKLFVEKCQITEENVMKRRSNVWKETFSY